MTDFGVRRLGAALGSTPYQRDWPHAPIHRLGERGAYMVTAGTYEKFPHFNTGSRLDFVLMSLFDFADEFGWLMQAWAVLINHYHFVGQSPDDPRTLRTMLRKLHSVIAVQINTEDSVRGRRVMDQYRDSHITFQKSYLDD